MSDLDNFLSSFAGALVGTAIASQPRRTHHTVVHHTSTRRPTAMGRSQFGSLLDILRNSYGDSSRLNVVRGTAGRMRGYGLTPNQLEQVLGTFSWDSSRLDAARALAPVALGTPRCGCFNSSYDGDRARRLFIG